ncbi:MAG: flagellar hook basal-body protein [Gemmatimonadota bacterium]
MTIRGLVNSARSLSYLLKLQQVTANNLANANTEGFKAERLTAHLAAGGRFPVPIERTDLQQGTLTQTGRPLDLALDGPGFMIAHTPDGDRLTRAGSLRLDAAGTIVDSHGNPILGEQGPIVVSGAALEIGPDGTVMVDGAVAGRIRMVTVDDPTALLKEGSNLFVTDQPFSRLPEGKTQLRQASLEQANVDPLLSTVDLVTIQRAYSANIDALKAMDGVLATITSEVGKT